MTQSTNSLELIDESEKRLKLLTQIGKDSYENHTKKVNAAITISGFIVTVNGILILANSNLLQFVITNKILFSNSEIIAIFSTVSIALSIISIFFSIAFIHMINPISHNLSPYLNFLKPIPYDDMLKLQSSTLFRIAEVNEQGYQKYRQKYYSKSLMTLGGATGLISASMIIISLKLIF